MRAIDDLMQSVDELALQRNYEIIIAILKNEEPNLCLYGRVFCHMVSAQKRLQKLKKKLEKLRRAIPFPKEQGDCEIELQLQEDLLTESVNNDTMSLQNLIRCGDCPACKYAT